MPVAPTMKVSFGKSGLTLIELMLVLGILGVLMSIVLPKYTEYRERIRQSEAIKDIAVLQGLIRNYRVDAGSYPASLADVGNGNKLDPWGRPYVYLDLTSVQGKGQSRKDHKLNPINSDFDLYSVGKDGLSRTQLTNKDSLDDIVRANDGAYIGLAVNFTRP